MARDGELADWIRAPNIASHPAVYERENEAIAADGRLDAALCDVHDWTGQVLLESDSIDVVHARFAYFFGAGAEAGLAEVARVLRPGGTFVAVDNDWGHGQFAELLRDATVGNAAMDPDATDRWWRERGARRINIPAGWRCRSPEELDAILRIEFPDEVVDRFLLRHPSMASISYGVALFVWEPPA